MNLRSRKRGSVDFGSKRRGSITINDNLLESIIEKQFNEEENDANTLIKKSDLNNHDDEEDDLVMLAK